MARRSRFIGYGSATLLVLLGVACAVAISGTAGQVGAFVLIGLGLVLATSLAFLEVGLSEDQARAREEKAASPPASRRRLRPTRPIRPRGLDRSRGRRRRLP
jgi:hypothetical protein